MKPFVRRSIGQDGFTMIEIISVLIIIGIISAVAIVRMTDTRDYDLNSQWEVVKAHLRLAQFRAMSSSSPYGINFGSATSYYLFKGSAPVTPIMLPGENNTTVSLTAKKSNLIINSAPQVITFNAYGSPGASDVIITTNAGNITITKNTGFIP